METEVTTSPVKILNEYGSWTKNNIFDLEDKENDPDFHINHRADHLHIPDHFRIPDLIDFDQENENNLLKILTSLKHTPIDEMHLDE